MTPLRFWAELALGWLITAATLAMIAAVVIATTPDWRLP